MKKSIIYISVIAAGLAAISCGHKDKAAADDGIREVDVAEAYTDSVVLHKTYPGYLQAMNNAAVVARVDGMILKQYYEDGSYVEKGQPLFLIDPTLYQDAVNKAQAELSSAISNRDYAQSHYNAVKKALEANAVSKMEMLSAESSLEQAEATINQCKAALHTARTNLGYCTVIAPISGNISASIVGAGNYVSGAASPVHVADIYDNSSFFAIFEIENTQYGELVTSDQKEESRLLKAMPLSFKSKLNNQYTANLVYDAPSVNKGTGTLKLRGAVMNKDNELKDGMYVTVSLPYGEMPEATVVKEASIGTNQLGKYLYVVNDSNKVVYTPIEEGELFQDSLRVVLKGVKPGDKYVTKAILTVREGETVKPILTK